MSWTLAEVLCSRMGISAEIVIFSLVKVFMYSVRMIEVKTVKYLEFLKTGRMKNDQIWTSGDESYAFKILN